MPYKGLSDYGVRGLAYNVSEMVKRKMNVVGSTSSAVIVTCGPFNEIVGFTTDGEWNSLYTSIP